MLPPKRGVIPVRIYLPPDEHGTATLRGVGYRSRCECGWQSATRRSYVAARQEMRDHRAEAHP